MKQVLFFFCLITAIFSPKISAHESRPLYIEVQEYENQSVSIKWKVPRSLAVDVIPVPFISTCDVSQALTISTMTDGHVGKYSNVCKDGIKNRILNTGFKVVNPSMTTIIFIKYLDGSENVKVLEPGDTEWKIPGQATVVSTIKSFLFLGAEHIALGWDHLLFIGCLFIIAASWLRILVTITGFTIAHSVTLALSALDVVRLPVAPVEACIALSIVFLAWELVRNKRRSIIWAYPLSVSASFGLLHGFGFASVLTDTGMPENHVLTALLFFNLGVELGQILFLFILMALLFLFKMALAALGTTYNEVILCRFSAYFAGITASYWFIQRTVVFI